MPPDEFSKVELFVPRESKVRTVSSLDLSWTLTFSANPSQVLTFRGIDLDKGIAPIEDIDVSIRTFLDMSGEDQETISLLFADDKVALPKRGDVQ